MDWFLYDRESRYKRVNSNVLTEIVTGIQSLRPSHYYITDKFLLADNCFVGWATFTEIWKYFLELAFVRSEKHFYAVPT